MYTDAYFMETLMRERMAEAEARAARRRLLGHARSPRSGPGLRERVRRLLGAARSRRATRLTGAPAR
jgi:hypothetical protein